MVVARKGLAGHIHQEVHTLAHHTPEEVGQTLVLLNDEEHYPLAEAQDSVFLAGTHSQRAAGILEDLYPSSNTVRVTGSLRVSKRARLERPIHTDTYHKE